MGASRTSILLFDHLRSQCICLERELPNPCSKEVKAKQDAVASEW